MEVSKIINNISSTIMEVSVAGGIGYLSVWALTNLNPMIGLVFGASYAASGVVTDPIFNNENSNPASKMVGAALKIAIASSIVMKTLGEALSIKAALGVTATIIVGNAAVAVLVLATLLGLAVLAYAIKKHFECTYAP